MTDGNVAFQKGAYVVLHIVVTATPNRLPDMRLAHALVNISLSHSRSF